jgi:hypothetical protein
LPLNYPTIHFLQSATVFAAARFFIAFTQKLLFNRHSSTTISMQIMVLKNAFTDVSVEFFRTVNYFSNKIDPTIDFACKSSGV